jgi:hypothetical protein
LETPEPKVTVFPLTPETAPLSNVGLRNGSPAAVSPTGTVVFWKPTMGVLTEVWALRGREAKARIPAVLSRTFEFTIFVSF